MEDYSLGTSQSLSTQFLNKWLLLLYRTHSLMKQIKGGLLLRVCTWKISHNPWNYIEIWHVIEVYSHEAGKKTPLICWLYVLQNSQSAVALTRTVLFFRGGIVRRLQCQVWWSNNRFIFFTQSYLKRSNDSYLICTYCAMCCLSGHNGNNYHLTMQCCSVIWMHYVTSMSCYAKHSWKLAGELARE